MSILVSGEKKEFDDGITLKELIEKENIENPDFVTVSVNEEFVDNEDFAAKKLNDGDTVEFLYFMGGGAVKRD